MLFIALFFHFWLVKMCSICVCFVQYGVLGWRWYYGLRNCCSVWAVYGRESASVVIFQNCFTELPQWSDIRAPMISVMPFCCCFVLHLLNYLRCWKLRYVSSDCQSVSCTDRCQLLFITAFHCALLIYTVSQKNCQLFFCSLSVKSEPILIKIGLIVPK